MGSEMCIRDSIMTIAIVAHDSKKELMAQFCIAYEGVLSKCRLIASGVTGNWIEEQTGLHVNCYLPGSEGGVHQIAASVFCHDIDMVLFFRDAQKAKEKDPTELHLLRLCDEYMVPLATNIATAEVLIHGLERHSINSRTMQSDMDTW